MRRGCGVDKYGGENIKEKKKTAFWNLSEFFMTFPLSLFRLISEPDQLFYEGFCLTLKLCGYNE